MGEPESEAERPHDDRSRTTIVLGTEFFEPEVDPVLDLLNRWEEYRLRGEEPPADWTGGIDPALRAELDRRIRRRKRLIELLDLTDPERNPEGGRDAPLPTFPGHEILGKIGRGGMGAVYRARDPELDRIVAIKTIAEGRLATPDQRERFRAEARAVARLHHPNIIGIHAIGEHEGLPYLVLEYAAGGSLAGRLAEKPMTPREAAALLEALARAVHAAHQAGVVHRDLKPSNILLTADGVPRVSDFGLAKLMDADGGRTITGQVLGSPSFMAPEQAEGRTREVGPPADVYSLGSILYQALTGRPPFLGESQLETLRLVVSNEVVPPCRLRPDVPRDLETICLKCLEKEPTRRYPDALALGDDLRRHIEGRPILARRTGPIERSWRWTRRNPGLAAATLTAAALLAALVVGAIASAMIYRDQRDRAIAAETRANTSRSEMRSVLEFVQNKVLTAARPQDQEGGLGREVSLRTALDAAEAGINTAFKDQPALEASIRFALGETYYYLGEPEPALRQTERTVALRRRALGPDHPDTLNASDNLAHFLMDFGRVDEAIALIADSLARRKAALGPDDPATITAKNDLAVVYQAAGRLDDALPLYEEALRQRRAKLGDDHPDTMFSMNNLANFLRELGRYPEAIALQKETLEKQRDRLGPDHPDTLLSMSNLAVAYRGAGRNGEALPLLEETYRRRRTKLGPDHPETLVSMSNLASGYRQAGRLDEAVSLLEETLKRRRATRGPGHPQTLRSVNALASAYLATAPAKAEPLLRDALAIREKKYPDDWGTFEARSLLGGSLLAQKKYTDAEPDLIRGYEGMKARAAKIPAGYRNALPDALERIIRLYDEWGKKDRAETWRKRRTDGR